MGVQLGTATAGVTTTVQVTPTHPLLADGGVPAQLDVGEFDVPVEVHVIVV